MKVLVPFNNRLVHGIVLKISDTFKDSYELKEIAEIEDEFLILNKELIALGYYMKQTTLCNLITAYQTMLPTPLKVKDQNHDYNDYDYFIVLKEEKEKIKDFISTRRKSNKTNILERLLNGEELNKKECNISSLRELIKLDLIKIEKRIHKQTSKKDIIIDNKMLNEEQKKLFIRFYLLSIIIKLFYYMV